MKSTSIISQLFVAAFAIVSLTAIATSPKNASQLYDSATKEFDSRNYISSLSLYLKADSAFVAEGKESSAEYAQSLHSTGRAYFNTDQVAKGREFTRRAMESREKLFGKTSNEYITSLNNYALSFFMEGELNEALANQLEVIGLCEKMNPPHPDEGMYLINLGRIYHAAKDEKNAVRYMEEALIKVEKFSENYEYALNFLGNAYMEAEDNVNMNRIMGLMEEHNRHELGKECNNLECHLQRAEYYYSIGDAAHAKDEYSAIFAMPLTESQKVTAYSHYAQFLTNERDFAQAGEYYALAAGACEAADGGKSNETAVSLLRQAGLCYFVGQEFDKSIQAHSRVITEVEKNGYSEQLKSSSLQGLGNAYSAKKDYTMAIEKFKQWVAHLENHGHSEDADYAKAFERLASAEKFQGDYKASEADYRKAIGLYNALGMHDEAHQAEVGLKSCLFYAHKDMGESEDNMLAKEQREAKLREIIRTSLNSLQQSGNYMGNMFTAQTYGTIAGSYAQLEEYENAIAYYEKYLECIRPALAETFILKNPKERELLWKQELQNVSEMSALIAELPQNSPELYGKLSKLIYEGQLLSKGILLSSNIEFEKIINKYGSKEMKSQYDAIKANLATIEKMTQEQKPTEDILTLTRHTDAMQLSLARESAKYGIFTDFLNITANDISDALTADDAAVEFVVLDTSIQQSDDMMAAVVVSKEFPSGITIPIGSVSQLQAIMADKEKFSKDEYATAIWGGIMQVIPDKKRIFFSPDGLLNNIGIEYLTINGKPMNEYVEMHRLSSTREIVRQHLPQPILYVALFGDIDYIDDGLPASDKRKFARRASDGISFNQLENTGREVKEITAILKKGLKKSHVFPYTGTKAGKAEFMSQKDVPVNILHIATHGKYIDDKKVSESDAMNRSILAFAGANRYDNFAENEGIVTAAEIADMTLQDCELAVLSACESGLGKLGDDGVFGLQRGFKNAGVKSLLVSLNEVADEATADMMIAFYRNLFDGSSSTKQEAFQKAQSDIRAKYPSDDTWASFILIDSFN